MVIWISYQVENLQWIGISMEDEAMLPKSIATYLVYFLVRFPNAEFAMLSKKIWIFPGF